MTADELEILTPEAGSAPPAPESELPVDLPTAPEELPVADVPVEEAPAVAPLIELNPLTADAVPVAEAETAPESPAEPVPEPPVPANKAAKKRRKPHILLRIPLQLLSFLLTFVLFAVMVVGVLLLDLRALTSSGGIKQLINTVIGSMTGSTTQTVPTPQRPLPEMTPMGNEDGDTVIDGGGIVLPGGETVTIPDGILDGGFDIGVIPPDILAGGDAGVLVDWIYDQVDEYVEEELPFTKEEIGAFVEESTVTEFLTDKLADYAEDFLNGTENAEITVDELMNLIEENEQLLKEKLNIELTPEVKAQISTAVQEIVVEQDINATIRDTVYETVDGALKETTESMGGISMEQIQSWIRLLTSDTVLYIIIGVAALILLLLCLLNFYNVPAGLTWASLPCINAGLILSLPLILLQTSTDLIIGILPEFGLYIGMAASYVTIFAPYHYGLLAIGVGLLVLSILWRIIRAVVRKRH